jgi:DNA-binding protein HU-beta
MIDVKLQGAGSILMEPAMNVSDLVDIAIAAEPKLTKAQAKAIIDGVFKSLTEAAVKGEEISIPGFGKFKVQAKPARTGRNPATGGTIEIAASKKVAFTPAKQLKDAVNG